MQDKKSFWQYAKEYLGMTVASLINALCMYIFVNPTKIVAGGLMGISTVLCYILQAFVPGVTVDGAMSIVYFVLNLPVLIYALVVLRGDFTFKSIYSIVFSSVVLAIFPMVIPHFQFNESQVISVILGGMLLGVAMHTATLQGASNGGTEVIGKIIAVKRPELDLSKVILIINFAITVVGGVILVIVEQESIWLIMYSLVFVVIAGEFMGILQRGFDHPQKYMIITTKYDELAKDITHQFKRGLTILDMDGQSEENPRKMIMVIIQYRQSPRLKQLIAHHDKDAFTFVKDVHDVFSRPTFNRSYKQK